ncbi:MAG: ferredoxin--NADP reductase [Gammaproteobacteria bacterium]|nr:ferredoxin--NADP reductase [Gammaproteobacteria bacterium]MDP2346092.1 ferredoxin--NADP reductase [Gammaproteobacteria bacterium]
MTNRNEAPGKGWIEGMVSGNVHLTQNLFSLRIEADLAPFTAGQYTSLALDVDGQRISQPYSILSAPGQQPVEFFFYTNPEGQLSIELGKLQTGDSVWIQEQAEGNFTLEQVPSSDCLWLLATGTGVAPFLSMLLTPEPWKRFRHVVLVYAVRQWEDLGYGDLIKGLQQAHVDQFTFVPFVSREKIEGSIHGHIPASITNGTLERVAGRNMTLPNSQFMLCGNPGMVQDATVALEQKGFNRHGDGVSGQITLESYW